MRGRTTIKFLILAGTLASSLDCGSSSLANPEVPDGGDDSVVTLGKRGPTVALEEPRKKIPAHGSPPFETESFSQLISFAGLPCEIRDEIFLNLDICQYNHYLTSVKAITSTKCRPVLENKRQIIYEPIDDTRLLPTHECELKIIKKAADELKELTALSPRYLDLVHCAQAFLRERSELLYGTLPDDEIAAQFMSIYKDVAGLSESSNWKAICMAALLRDNSFILNWHLFDLQFITDTFEIMTKVAAHFSISMLKELRRNARTYVVTHESCDLFDAVFASYRLGHDAIKGLISDCVSLGHEKLLRRIWNKVNTPEYAAKDSIMNHICYTTCFYAQPAIFTFVLEEFSPTPQTLHQCFLGVSTSGNLDFLKYILSLQDNDQQYIGNLTERGVEGVAEYFHLAAMNNHLPMMYFLFARSINMQQIRSLLFSSAIQFGIRDMIDLHLGLVVQDSSFWPAFSKKDFTHALELSLAHGQLDVFNYLVHLSYSNDHFRGFPVTFSVPNVFLSACKYGHIHVIEFLLGKNEHGEYLYEEVERVLYMGDGFFKACQKGNLPIVKLLLTCDAETQPRSQTKINVFVNSLMTGKWEIAELLLQKSFTYKGIQYSPSGFDPAASDNYLLRCAVKHSAIEIIKLLLKRDENGDPIFPGVEVTPRIRELASDVICPEVIRALGLEPL